MRLLSEIPLEKYQDIPYCLDYLNKNDTIGNEEVEYNGIWHVHWMGPINRKLVLQLKSIITTQHVSKIYLWNENDEVTFNSPNFKYIEQLKDFIEVRNFNKNVFLRALGDFNVKERIWNNYLQLSGRDRRFKSDIFRFVILNIFGGVYTDADTLMLRDVRDIKINNWSSQWGTSPLAEFCILKLEKKSDVYEQMFMNNPNNILCHAVYDIKHGVSQSPNVTREYSPYSWDRKNLNLVSLPGRFFDILWGSTEEERNNLPLKNYSQFFEKSENNYNLDNFFKGCFSFHWHNRWENPELKKSPMGQLNQIFDDIIKDKFNIDPLKIFKE